MEQPKLMNKDAKEFRDLEALSLEVLCPRDRVLSTAIKLFYRVGVHAVGVDRIIAESAVAKMTFYKHFPSKAALVAEYLQYKQDAWLELVRRYTSGEKSALERLLGIFDALEFSFNLPEYRGCPFVKGLAEFGPDAESQEIRTNIARHFTETRELVEELIAPLALIREDVIVETLLSLIEGSIIVAQSTGRPEIALINKEAARALILNEKS